LLLKDNWSAVYEQVAAVYSWSWVLFITFISLAASIFVNLIIAVICDAVHELTIGDKAKLHGMQVKQSSDGIETSLTKTSTTQPKSSTVQRIRELEEQLDEIVSVQEYLQKTIKVLTDLLKDDDVDSSTRSTTATPTAGFFCR
jgi:hypothetical protein